MENLSITSVQNVQIEHPVASVGERIIATFLDFLFMSAYVIMMLLISGISRSSGYIYWFIVFLPVVLYHLLFEVFMEGQSLGKKIMNIKVMNSDGSRPGFTSYFLRWIFRIIDITFLFGGIAVIIIITNGKGKRIGDLAANTSVIRMKNKFSGESIYTEIPENYKIKYPEVNYLSAEEIHTAKETLDFLKKNGYTGTSSKLIIKLKNAFEQKMGIRTEEVPSVFIEQVIKDYNAQYQNLQ
ncbi:MAG: RDD family protein [Bacteroidota bacterium]